ncbi:hypothetical protein KIN20_024467 [Parelaphostrongylus tenuis]|uniref:Uncharacterized protein n=1 Tax=Parelaphostrongylus tenuis TaxID=148309 RepID=A0AAD5QTN6_PARTN|nr:hypothetical protein KIN20_024467 [Parelaphostrongylus tenuis]
MRDISGIWLMTGVASKHTIELEEYPKCEVATVKQQLKLEEKEQLAADKVEDGCDVVVLDDVSSKLLALGHKVICAGRETEE